MSVWSSYEQRLRESGSTTREAEFNKESQYLRRQLPKSLSYHKLLIDGAERSLAVINSENYNIKTLCTMPGEDIDCGALVEWRDNRWLVTEKDANNELYTRCKMKQCNHLLRWLWEDGSLVEQWCIVEDGTKYLTGETENGSRNDVGLYVGDTRITVTLPRNRFTAQIERDQRFLIDDPDANTVLAYRVSKPFKVGGVYNRKGVMSFVLTEENTTDDDNTELRIADYYKFFPRESNAATVEPDANMKAVENSGRKVWL